MVHRSWDCKATQIFKVSVYFFLLSQTVRNSGFTVKLNPSGVFFFLFLFQNSSLFNTNHYLHVNLLVGVFLILMISKAWFSFYCMFELDFLMDWSFMWFKNFVWRKYVLHTSHFLCSVRTSKYPFMDICGIRSMCGAESTWLPSMCGEKSALHPSMCGAKSSNLLRTLMGAMQTFLRTLKGAMQTLLRTWKGDIVSGTKK